MLKGGPAFAYKQDETQQNVTSLSGFTPGETITYTILSSQGVLSKGSKTISENGSVSIPYPALKGQSDYLAYDFKIGEGHDSHNVLLRINTHTGQVTASGNGLEEFSDLEVSTPTQNIQSRADWAGSFREDIKMRAKDAEDFQAFKIALYGVNATLDVPDEQQNPGIIQVLVAPNGGTAEKSGVNEFTPSAAPLSTSNQDAVQGSIDLIKENYIQALMLMTEQLSATAMQSTMAIGQFFDAKQQLETNRLHRQLHAQAVKDYHPSDGMCRVGSYMRSVAKSEEKARADKRKLNEIIMAELTGEYTLEDEDLIQMSVEARMKQFREVYCNPLDNNDGLEFICEHDQDNELSNSTRGSNPSRGIGAPDKVRMNKDIDFLRTMAFPQTLNMDFSQDPVTPDEEDAIALATNLYWSQPFNWTPDEELADKYPAFLDARKVMAMKNIAHNSYASLAGMKAQAEPVTGNVEPGWAFMKTFMREFGITDEEIEDWIGEQPSYWAQMDILTKKIYQSPEFYTNLYNKPANVERMSTALEAIKLMQMRDHYESSLRVEMINAAMLENEIAPKVEEVNARLLVE